jgi:hypothetical protein
VFSEQGRGVAYIAKKGDKEWVVHNGNPENPHAEIAHLTISPDGQRVSYRCALVNKQQLVSDGVARQVFDNVREQVYSPDSRHLAYLVQIADRTGLVLDEALVEDSSIFGDFFFTQDSTKLVYSLRLAGDLRAHLVIFDLKTRTKSFTEYLETPIAVNRKADRVAVVVQDGDKQRVIDFALASPNEVHKSELFDVVKNISLGADGRSVAFLAEKDKSRYIVLNGKKERIPDGLSAIGSPQVRPDLKGAGVVLSTSERYNRRSILYHAFQGNDLKKEWYEEIQELVYDRVHSSFAYAAKRGERWFVVVDGKEGPDYDKVVSLMFSPDGRKLVYRARNGTKRFVVVVDVAKREHRLLPAYEMVFPEVFTADGRSIAYGVKDGNQLIWKVERL